MSVWFETLPAGWVDAPLKSRLLRNDGGVWGQDPDGDNDTVVLRSTEQRVDGAWQIDEPAARKLSPSERDSALLEVGDLVVTKSSGSDLHIGKTGLVTKQVAAFGACYSNFMQRLRVDGRTEARFVHYWMNSTLCREQFSYLSSTTSGLANLNGEMLGKVRMAFPDRPTQARIANFLDEQTARIDALIAEKERLVEALHGLMVSRLAFEMGGGASASINTHYEWYPAIPRSWKVIPFKYAVRFVEGPGILAQDFRDEGVPLLRVSSLRGAIATLDGCNYLDPVKVAKVWNHFRVKRGDLLISASASIGTVSLVAEDAEGAVPYTGIIILRPDDGIAIRDFVRSFVISDQFMRQIDSMKAGATIQHFGPTHLNRVVMAVPESVAEQVAVAARLERWREAYEESVASITAHVLSLREYRSSLISAAVTGQLDIDSFERGAA